MKRFPYPWLAVFLAAMWLALAGRVTPGQVILAIAFACLGSWGMSLLRRDRPRPKRPKSMLQLIAFVTMDIIRSNIAVVRIITQRDYQKTSNFLVIPLDMTDKTGLTILAGIITATPGTLWVSHDRESNRLLLHILDFVDEEGWLEIMKNRYERLLMEIFE